MHSALASLSRLIGRSLLSLLVIAAILAAGHFLIEQGRTLRQSSADLASLRRAADTAGETRALLVAQARSRSRQAAADSLAQIDHRIAVQEQLLASGQFAPVTLPSADPLTERLLASVSAPLQKAVARQELDFLLRLRAWLGAAASRNGQRAILAQRRREHADAYAEYARLQAQKAALGEATQAWMASRLPLDDRWSRLQRQIDRAAAASNQAHANYTQQQAAIRQLGELASAPVFSIDDGALDAAIAPLTTRLDAARAAVSDNWLARFGTPVLRQMPLALAILLSGFAMHLLVKALFYYVLAPLAGRCKPIRLAEPAKTGPAPQITSTPSAVSHTVYLAAGQELLLLPDYLQRVSAAALKTTKWLFDWHTPWTCLIAGMVMLTRVRTGDSDDAIVISSNADALSEVALIAIPAGAALVFQPRALVGVIQQTAAPLRIARRWRLFSVHAWLTMQLRYLVFAGPATLVVKGTRGVRVERAGTAAKAGAARLISQAATLGFSPQLDYSTVRSATFIAYYMDRTALLDDRFEGSGVYAYAETPQRALGGFASRGLEGVVDAVLKVFGI